MDGVSHFIHEYKGWSDANGGQLLCATQANGKNCYPLPCDDQLDQLVGTSVFLSLNLAQG